MKRRRRSVFAGGTTPAQDAAWAWLEACLPLNVIRRHRLGEIRDESPQAAAEVRHFDSLLVHTEQRAEVAARLSPAAREILSIAGVDVPAASTPRLQLAKHAPRSAGGVPSTS